MKKEEGQILAARVPKPLRRRLERAAKAADRTCSAELRVRLEHSLAMFPVIGAPAGGSKAS